MFLKEVRARKPGDLCEWIAAQQIHPRVEHEKVWLCVAYVGVYDWLFFLHCPTIIAAALADS